MSKKVTCWMCGGWGYIHPLDTGEKSHGQSPFKSKPIYVWVATRAQYQPGSVVCPVCNGDLIALPFESKYEGDILPIESRIW